MSARRGCNAASDERRGLATTVPASWAVAERAALGLARDTVAVAWQFEAGVSRLRRVVPGQMRLLRWRSSRFVREARPLLRLSRSSGRLLRRVLPIAACISLTLSCGLVSNDDDSGGSRIAPMPDLSKSRRAEPRPDAPWTYVLPVDYGVRVDRSGKGHFRAPRFHGEHNGIDMLAPIGTPTFSACEGKAVSAASRSFGRWVRVICPVPDEYVKDGEPRPWASFFYAHLNSVDLPHDEWVDVSAGQQIGTVGKSGNARGPNVQPHVHLELIIQTNQRKAMDEQHLGNDQSSVPAATYFAEKLEQSCMDPFGFRPKSKLLRRARRLDPFVVLTCLAGEKPDFERPVGDLRTWSHPWDQFYVASNFNVNRGPKD